MRPTRLFTLPSKLLFSSPRGRPSVSLLPAEGQWFLLASLSTRQSNISHVSAEKRPLSVRRVRVCVYVCVWREGVGGYALLYIKNDGSASAMQQEVQRIWLTRSTKPPPTAPRALPLTYFLHPNNLNKWRPSLCCSGLKLNPCCELTWYHSGSRTDVLLNSP